jgi:hypothetical protein
MPGTFTHPLAILPFRRLCPVRLNFAALVIGSMSPDFGYYFRQFPAARFAHTIAGTLLVCLPTGFMALAIFYLLRQPLCYILPQPHRGVLMPLAAIRPILRPQTLLTAALSILLGAWTHTIWDSFTHDGAWSVERISFLRAPLFHIGNTAFVTSYVLQQVSTFGGGVALAIAYFGWLRRQRAAEATVPDTLSDRRRYCLIALLAVIAVVVAAPAAVRMAAKYQGYLAFRVLVFRTAVYAAAVFIPMLAFSSFVLFAIDRKRHKELI